MMNLNSRKKQSYKSFIIILGFLSIIIGCVPPEEVPLGKPVLDLNDPVVQQIVLFQDQQEFDSLRMYLTHEDPKYRFNATRALSSFQTERSIPFLRQLLKDSITAIRAEAAYAAGQLGDPSLLPDVVGAFNNDLTSSNINSTLNLNVLEAIGKLGTDKELLFITTAKPYRITYDTLNLGKALSIYHFGLRGIHNKEGTKNMVEMIIKEYPNKAALIAATYLNQFQNVDIDSYKFQLLQAFKKEENVHVRSQLMGALSRMNDKDLLDPIFDILSSEKDFRVVVSGLNKLDNFEYIKVISKLQPFLESKNPHIVKAAARYLERNGKAVDAYYYMNYVKTLSSQSKRPLYKAILSLIRGNSSSTRLKISKELIDQYNSTTDQYAKREIITALGSNIYLIDQVKNLAFNDSTSIIVKTGAIEALGQILAHGLDGYSRGTRRNYSMKIGNILNEAMSTGDPGILAAAAYAISETPQERLLSIDQAIIKQNYNRLTLPKDVEAIYTLADALHHIDSTQQLPKPEIKKFRNIDFEDYQRISDTLIVTIGTTKGNIEIELFKEHAPATVLNFISLLNDQFYNNKYFHRVVPNFVIQTGCPRGDGYGNLDFAIRSEVGPLRFLEEGFVGMASMGLHTEGTQFFITQAPTPRLSGRYTNFGKVISGMDVVNNIQVGDYIKNITLN